MVAQCRQSKKHGMIAKKAVKDFIRTRFPGADADAFLASFSWQIPSNNVAAFEMTDWNQYKVTKPHADQPRCKAGNVSCISLSVEHSGDSSHLMFCDGCCAERRFCRDCCCILCMKPVSYDHGGYAYVRCETTVDGAICGHLAHINCGLKCYLAGKVGGSISLDAEYYCRFCDANTDLVPHAEKLLQICDSLAPSSRETLGMVLKTGVLILRGSERDTAKGLFQRFSSAYSLVRSGGNYKYFEKEGSTSEVIPGPSELSDPTKVTSHLAMAVNPPVACSKFDHKAEIIKLAGEIDQILQIMNKWQEQDDAQRDLIQSLHQQLDHKRHVIEGIVGRVRQIKEKVMKLKDLKDV